MVLPDNDPLKPALYQGFIEGFQVCGLLLDEILQFIDAGNLCIPGSSGDGAFFSLFSEFEDLIGNLIIGLFVELPQIGRPKNLTIGGQYILKLFWQSISGSINVKIKHEHVSFLLIGVATYSMRHARVFVIILFSN